MVYFFSPYIGSGTREDPYRPSGVDGLNYSSIDFRSPGLATGYCFVTAPVFPAQLNQIDLGSDPSATIPTSKRTQIRVALGLLTLTANRLQTLLPELLVDRANGTNWRPLRPEANGWMRVYLGDTRPLWEQKSISGGAVRFTESFNTADSDTLGPDQTWNEIAGDFDIVSNQARAITNGAIARCQTALATENHFCQAVVTGLDTGVADNSVHVICRKDNTATLTYYLLEVNTTNGTRMWKREAGTYTSLATSAGIPTVPFVTRLDVNGSSIKGYNEGVLKTSATDTAITGNLYTAMSGNFAGNPSPRPTVDNFQAGDLVYGIVARSPRLNNVLVRSGH